jgi:hypothetical protein
MLAAALHCQAMTAYRMVEVVDAVSVAVLRTAGADDPTARDVLATLWEQFRAPTADIPTPTLRRSDRERELRGLGERIRVVRRGRRLSRPRAGRLAGIGPDQLADLERGSATPNALTIHRLADVLQVPLPLLVDEKQAPVDLLRQLLRREWAGDWPWPHRHL